MVPSFRKLLAAILSLVLFSEPVLAALGESTLWSERRAALSIQSPAPRPAPLAPVAPSWPNLPSSLRDVLANVSFQNASIQDVHSVPGGKAPVVLIQDVHMNGEAQKNIAAVLEQLVATKKVGFIGIEGAFTRFDFSDFQNARDKAAVRRAAVDFLDKDRIAAHTYVGLTASQPLPPMIGIDDVDGYERNVQAYLDASDIKRETLRKLDEAERDLELKKSNAFNTELKRFDDLRISHRAGVTGIGDYARQLNRIAPSAAPAMTSFVEAYEAETKLDFSQIERERKVVLETLAKTLEKSELAGLVDSNLAYRAGKMSFGGYYQALKNLCERHGLSLKKTPAFDAYVRYTLLADGIKTGELFSALRESEKRAVERLARTPVEKELCALSQKLALSRKLVDFSLTPEEWGDYSSSWNVSTQGPLSRGKVDPGLKHAGMTGLKPFEDFYREADTRSKKMVANLESQNVQGSSILVSGGFHTPEIAALLRERGVPYVVLAPKITAVAGASGSAYLSIFAREKTPLQKLFSGHKLFIHPVAVAAVEARPLARPPEAIASQLIETRRTDVDLRNAAKLGAASNSVAPVDLNHGENGILNALHNVSFGTICEDGHRQGEDGLNAQIRSEFQRLGYVVDKPSGEDLVEADVDYAYGTEGASLDFENVRDRIREITDAPRAGAPFPELFFIRPPNGKKLWWVDGRYAAAHYSQKTNRIYISLTLAEILNERQLAAIGLHEMAHRWGVSHAVATELHQELDLTIDAVVSAISSEDVPAGIETPQAKFERLLAWLKSDKEDERNEALLGISSMGYRELNGLGNMAPERAIDALLAYLDGRLVAYQKTGKEVTQTVIDYMEGKRLAELLARPFEWVVGADLQDWVTATNSRLNRYGRSLLILYRYNQGPLEYPLELLVNMLIDSAKKGKNIFATQENVRRILGSKTARKSYQVLELIKDKNIERVMDPDEFPWYRWQVLADYIYSLKGNLYRYPLDMRNTAKASAPLFELMMRPDIFLYLVADKEMLMHLVDHVTELYLRVGWTYERVYRFLLGRHRLRLFGHSGFSDLQHAFRPASTPEVGDGGLMILSRSGDSTSFGQTVVAGNDVAPGDVFGLRDQILNTIRRRTGHSALVVERRADGSIHVISRLPKTAIRDRGKFERVIALLEASINIALGEANFDDTKKSVRSSGKVRVGDGYGHFKDVSPEKLLGDGSSLVSPQAREFFYANDAEKLKFYLDSDFMRDFVRQLGNKGSQAINLPAFVSSYLEKVWQFETQSPYMAPAFSALVYEAYKFSKAGSLRENREAGRVKIYDSNAKRFYFDEAEPIAKLDGTYSYLIVPKKKAATVEDFSAHVERLQSRMKNGDNAPVFIYHRGFAYKDRLFLLVARAGKRFDATMGGYRFELIYASQTYSEILGVEVFERQEAVTGYAENDRVGISWFAKPRCESAHELPDEAIAKFNEIVRSPDFDVPALSADADEVEDLHLRLGLVFDTTGNAIGASYANGRWVPVEAPYDSTARIQVHGGRFNNENWRQLVQPADNADVGTLSQKERLALSGAPGLAPHVSAGRSRPTVTLADFEEPNELPEDVFSLVMDIINKILISDNALTLKDWKEFYDASDERRDQTAEWELFRKIISSPFKEYAEEDIAAAHLFVTTARYPRQMITLERFSYWGNFLSFHLSSGQLNRATIEHFAEHIRRLALSNVTESVSQAFKPWEKLDFSKDKDLETFLVSSITMFWWSELSQHLLEAYLNISDSQTYDRFIQNLGARLTSKLKTIGDVSVSPISADTTLFDMEVLEGLAPRFNSPLAPGLGNFFRRTKHVSPRALELLEAMAGDAGRSYKDKRFPSVIVEDTSSTGLDVLSAIERFKKELSDRSTPAPVRALYAPLKKGSPEEKTLGIEYSYFKMGDPAIVKKWAREMAAMILRDHPEIALQKRHWVVAHEAGPKKNPRAASLLAMEIANVLDLPISDQHAGEVVRDKKVLFIDDAMMSGKTIETSARDFSRAGAIAVNPYVVVVLESEGDNDYEKQLSRKVVDRDDIQPLLELLNNTDATPTTRLLEYVSELSGTIFTTFILPQLTPAAKLKLYSSVDALPDALNLTAKDGAVWGSRFFIVAGTLFAILDRGGIGSWEKNALILFAGVAYVLARAALAAVLERTILRDDANIGHIYFNAKDRWIYRNVHGEAPLAWYQGGLLVLLYLGALFHETLHALGMRRESLVYLTEILAISSLMYLGHASVTLGILGLLTVSIGFPLIVFVLTAQIEDKQPGWLNREDLSNYLATVSFPVVEIPDATRITAVLKQSAEEINNARTVGDIHRALNGLKAALSNTAAFRVIGASHFNFGKADFEAPALMFYINLIMAPVGIFVEFEPVPVNVGQVKWNVLSMRLSRIQKRFQVDIISDTPQTVDVFVLGEVIAKGYYEANGGVDDRPLVNYVYQDGKTVAVSRGKDMDETVALLSQKYGVPVHVNRLSIFIEICRTAANRLRDFRKYYFSEVKKEEPFDQYFFDSYSKALLNEMVLNLVDASAPGREFSNAFERLKDGEADLIEPIMREYFEPYGLRAVLGSVMARVGSIPVKKLVFYLEKIASRFAVEVRRSLTFDVVILSGRFAMSEAIGNIAAVSEREPNRYEVRLRLSSVWHTLHTDHLLLSGQYNKALRDETGIEDWDEYEHIAIALLQRQWPGDIPVGTMFIRRETPRSIRAFLFHEIGHKIGEKGELIPFLFEMESDNYWRVIYHLLAILLEKNGNHSQEYVNTAKKIFGEILPAAINKNGRLGNFPLIPVNDQTPARAYVDKPLLSALLKLPDADLLRAVERQLLILVPDFKSIVASVDEQMDKQNFDFPLGLSTEGSSNLLARDGAVWGSRFFIVAGTLFAILDRGGIGSWEKNALILFAGVAYVLARAALAAIAEARVPRLKGNLGLIYYDPVEKRARRNTPLFSELSTSQKLLFLPLLVLGQPHEFLHTIFSSEWPVYFIEASLIGVVAALGGWWWMLFAPVVAVSIYAAVTQLNARDEKAPEPQPVEPVQMIGPYRIVQRLTSTSPDSKILTFHAVHKDTGQNIILKVLAEDIAPVYLEQWKAGQRFEIAVYQAMKGRFFDIRPKFGGWGKIDETPWFALEFIKGRSLEAWLKQTKSQEEKLTVFKRLIKGVSELHGFGIYHRDLKPANLMVTPEDKVKIVDFQTSRGPAVPRNPGLITPTPAYAPSQSHWDENERADVFALGVILFEMGSGDWAIEKNGDLAHTLADYSDVPFATLKSLIKNKLPAQWKRFASVIAKAVTSNHSMHFKSVADFIAEFETEIGRSKTNNLLAHEGATWAGRYFIVAATLFTALDRAGIGSWEKNALILFAGIAYVLARAALAAIAEARVPRLKENLGLIYYDDAKGMKFNIPPFSTLSLSQKILFSPLVPLALLHEFLHRLGIKPEWLVYLLEIELFAAIFIGPWWWATVLPVVTIAVLYQVLGWRKRTPPTAQIEDKQKELLVENKPIVASEPMDEVDNVDPLDYEVLKDANDASPKSIRTTAVYLSLIALQFKRFVLSEGRPDPEQSYEKYQRALSILINKFGEDAFTDASKLLFNRDLKNLDFYTTVFGGAAHKMHSDIQPVAQEFIELAVSYTDGVYPIHVNMHDYGYLVNTRSLFGDPDFWKFVRTDKNPVFKALMDEIALWPDQIYTTNAYASIMIRPRAVLKKYFPDAFKEIQLGAPNFKPATSTVVSVRTLERRLVIDKWNPEGRRASDEKYSADRENRYQELLRNIRGGLIGFNRKFNQHKSQQQPNRLHRLSLDELLNLSKEPDPSAILTPAIESLFGQARKNLDPLEFETFLQKMGDIKREELEVAYDPSKDTLQDLKRNVIATYRKVIERLLGEIPYSEGGQDLASQQISELLVDLSEGRIPKILLETSEPLVSVDDLGRFAENPSIQPVRADGAFLTAALAALILKERRESILPTYDQRKADMDRLLGKPAGVAKNPRMYFMKERVSAEAFLTALLETNPTLPTRIYTAPGNVAYYRKILAAAFPRVALPVEIEPADIPDVAGKVSRGDLEAIAKQDLTGVLLVLQGVDLADDANSLKKLDVILFEKLVPLTTPQWDDLKRISRQYLQSA